MKMKASQVEFYGLLSVLQGGMWLQSDIEVFLRDFNLSHGRFWILMALLEVPGNQLNPAVLAREMGKSKPTITRMINRLEKDGQVTFIPDTSDRRSKLLTLTDTSRELMNKIIPLYSERIHEMTCTLTPEELKKLIELISKIAFLDPMKKIRVPL